ncbi:MAG: tRNA lysidine(34) synthetase TilS [Woeseiaceae bacterium]
MIDTASIYSRVRAAANTGSCTRIVVAFSGGLDSTVLLHLLATGGFANLSAVYIDHGLQGDQAVWHAHVRDQCEVLDVPLESVSLNLTCESQESVEAIAREGRYKALGELSGPALIVLAQHQEDQAETLMLQLLRGSGPAGLSAMPALFPLGDNLAFRPLLGTSRDHVRAYADQHALQWFDDPTNSDTRFDRNYLRHEVMPKLKQRWPKASLTLARAARWQADAQQLQEQLATYDLRRVAGAADTLNVTTLQQLSIQRRANAIRQACRQRAMPVPPEARLQTLDLMIRQSSGRGEVRWADCCARRYRESLYLMCPVPENEDLAFDVPLAVDQWLALPRDRGLLRLHGIDPATGVSWRCKFRQGGERIRPREQGPSTPLARWFQAHGVPPWERQRIPLIYVGDELAAVGAHVLRRFREQFPGIQVDHMMAPESRDNSAK